MQDRGDIAGAKKVSAGLENKILMGYVLQDRYFAKGYTTKAAEIESWFEEYDDLPVAGQMYQLGKQKKAKLPDEKPKEIFGYSSGTCSFVMREDPINLIYGKTFPYLSGEDKKTAGRLMRQIGRYLRGGKTLNARRVLESKDAQRLFSTADKDAARTALAFSYFLDGEDEKSLQFIESVLKQSANRIPLAYWTAGLVHWRRGAIENAAADFESAARHDKVYPLLQASAAFWAARAYLKLGNYEKVGELLEISAGHPRTFYGILSLRLMGVSIDHVWETPATLQDDVTADFSHPALTRFYALKQIGQPALAGRELSKLYIEADEEAKAILMMISSKNGFAEDLSLVAGRLKDDATRYPAPNWTPKDGWKADKALVFAFVMQESCFNATAKSSVGAMGLMQIMPKTGRDLARLLNFPWQLKHLQDPEYNLSLGQNYLLRLMNSDDIKRNLIFTAVAYNAGPGNLNKFKNKMTYHDDPLLFIESIPSRETRSFVERIMVNYWTYRSLMNQPTHSLDEVAAGKWPLYHPFDRK